MSMLGFYRVVRKCGGGGKTEIQRAGHLTAGRLRSQKRQGKSVGPLKPSLTNKLVYLPGRNTDICHNRMIFQMLSQQEALLDPLPNSHRIRGQGIKV